MSPKLYSPSKNQFIIASIIGISFYAIYVLFKKRKLVESPSIKNQTPQHQGNNNKSMKNKSEKLEIGKNSTTISKKEAMNLVKLLTVEDEKVISRVLVSISNLSAFTENQNLFRECRCIEQLASMVPIYNIKSQTTTNSLMSEDLYNNLLIAMNNLSLNVLNQSGFVAAIANVIRNLQSNILSEKTVKNSLMFLTNMTVTEKCHDNVVPVLTFLTDNVFLKNEINCQLESLKVLINLMNGKDVTVDALLHLDIPEDVSRHPLLNDYFKNPDALIRWLTLLNLALEYMKTREHFYKCTSTLADKDKVQLVDLFVVDSFRNNLMNDLAEYSRINLGGGDVVVDLIGRLLINLKSYNKV